jgi:hypothetical protein
MRRLALALGLVAATTLTVYAEEPPKGPPAAELLNQGVAKAKPDGKRVFLVFGSPTCGWCKYLDKFHADPEVAKLLDKHMVLVKVDVVTNPGGKELYEKYGAQRGVPAFTILDTDLKVLADSGDKGQNVGFPYKPEEVEHYAKAMKKSIPALTEKDVDLPDGEAEGGRAEEVNHGGRFRADDADFGPGGGRPGRTGGRCRGRVPVRAPPMTLTCRGPGRRDCGEAGSVGEPRATQAGAAGDIEVQGPASGGD